MAFLTSFDAAKCPVLTLQAVVGMRSQIGFISLREPFPPYMFPSTAPSKPKSNYVTPVTFTNTASTKAILYNIDISFKLSNYLEPMNLM